MLSVRVGEYSSACDGLCAVGISAFNISSYCYLLWQLVSKPTVYTQSSRLQNVRSYCLPDINVISPTLWNEIIVCYALECWLDATLGYVLIRSNILDRVLTSVFVNRERSFRSPANINPYPTAFPYGNGMVLHFYQQQESSTTKTVHKVINKGLKAYV